MSSIEKHTSYSSSSEVTETTSGAADGASGRKDVAQINDEDQLRKLWHQTEDFAEKKQIRSRMYKLREQRLKEFYTSGEVLNEITHQNSGPQEAPCQLQLHGEHLMDFDQQVPTIQLHLTDDDMRSEDSFSVRSSSSMTMHQSSSHQVVHAFSSEALESFENVEMHESKSMSTEHASAKDGEIVAHRTSVTERVRQKSGEEPVGQRTVVTERTRQKSGEKPTSERTVITETSGNTENYRMNEINTKKSETTHEKMISEVISEDMKNSAYSIHSSAMAGDNFISLKSKEIRDSESPSRDIQVTRETEPSSTTENYYYSQESRHYDNSDKVNKTSNSTVKIEEVIEDSANIKKPRDIFPAIPYDCSGSTTRKRELSPTKEAAAAVAAASPTQQKSRLPRKTDNRVTSPKPGSTASSPTEETKSISSSQKKKTTQLTTKRSKTDITKTSETKTEETTVPSKSKIQKMDKQTPKSTKKDTTPKSSPRHTAEVVNKDTETKMEECIIEELGKLESYLSQKDESHVKITEIIDDVDEATAKSIKQSMAETRPRAYDETDEHGCVPVTEPPFKKRLVYTVGDEEESPRKPSNEGPTDFELEIIPHEDVDAKPATKPQKTQQRRIQKPPDILNRPSRVGRKDKGPVPLGASPTSPTKEVTETFIKRTSDTQEAKVTKTDLKKTSSDAVINVKAQPLSKRVQSDTAIKETSKKTVAAKVTTRKKSGEIAEGRKPSSEEFKVTTLQATISVEEDSPAEETCKEIKQTRRVTVEEQSSVPLTRDDSLTNVKDRVHLESKVTKRRESQTEKTSREGSPVKKKSEDRTTTRTDSSSSLKKSRKSVDETIESEDVQVRRKSVDKTAVRTDSSSSLKKSRTTKDKTLNDDAKDEPQIKKKSVDHGKTATRTDSSSSLKKTRKSVEEVVDTVVITEDVTVCEDDATAEIHVSAPGEQKHELEFPDGQPEMHIPPCEDDRRIKRLVHTEVTRETTTREKAAVKDDSSSVRKAKALFENIAVTTPEKKTRTPVQTSNRGKVTAKSAFFEAKAKAFEETKTTDSTRRSVGDRSYDKPWSQDRSRPKTEVLRGRSERKRSDGASPDISPDRSYDRPWTSGMKKGGTSSPDRRSESPPTSGRRSPDRTYEKPWNTNSARRTSVEKDERSQSPRRRESGDRSYDKPWIKNTRRTSTDKTGRRPQSPTATKRSPDRSYDKPRTANAKPKRPESPENRSKSPSESHKPYDKPWMTNAKPKRPDSPDGQPTDAHKPHDRSYEKPWTSNAKPKRPGSPGDRSQSPPDSHRHSNHSPDRSYDKPWKSNARPNRPGSPGSRSPSPPDNRRSSDHSWTTKGKPKRPGSPGDRSKSPPDTHRHSTHSSDRGYDKPWQSNAKPRRPGSPGSRSPSPPDSHRHSTHSADRSYDKPWQSNARPKRPGSPSSRSPSPPDTRRPSDRSYDKPWISNSKPKRPGSPGSRSPSPPDGHRHSTQPYDKPWQSNARPKRPGSPSSRSPSPPDTRRSPDRSYEKPWTANTKTKSPERKPSNETPRRKSSDKSKPKSPERPSDKPTRKQKISGDETPDDRTYDKPWLRNSQQKPRKDSSPEKPTSRKTSEEIPRPKEKSPTRATAKPKKSRSPSPEANKAATLVKRTSSKGLIGAKVEAFTARVERKMQTKRNSKPEIDSSGLKIEEIEDLAVLEAMLEEATDYDARRRIRAQIRVVKRKLPTSTATRPTSSRPAVHKTPDSAVPSTQRAPATKPQQQRRPSKPDDAPTIRKQSTTSDEGKSPSGSRKASRTDTKTSRTTVTKDDTDAAKPRVETSMDDQHNEVETAVKKSAVKSVSKEVNKASSGSAAQQPQPKGFIPARLPEQKKDTTEVTSSYGMGPTDDYGMPLFGLSALRRKPRQETPSEEKAVDDNDGVNSGPRSQMGPTDSTGKPLFGLRAVTVRSSEVQQTVRRSPSPPALPAERRDSTEVNSSVIPERHQSLRSIIKRHEDIVTKETVTSPVSRAAPRAKLRDSFTREDESDDDEDEIAPLETRRSPSPELHIPTRSKQLKEIIQHHETQQSLSRSPPQSPTTKRPSAKLRDSFTGRPKSPEKSDDLVDTKKISERSQQLRDIIHRHEQRIKVRGSPSSPQQQQQQSVVVTSVEEQPKRPGILKKTRSTDRASPELAATDIIATKPVNDRNVSGSITMSRQSIRSETVAKDGEEPVTRVTSSESHYKWPSKEGETPEIKTVTATETYTGDRSSPRRSITAKLDDAEESRTTTSTKSESVFSRARVGGGSVRALSKKFQQEADDLSNKDVTKSRSYPKAGLIYRTSSLREKETNGFPSTNDTNNRLTGPSIVEKVTKTTTTTTKTSSRISSPPRKSSRQSPTRGDGKLSNKSSSRVQPSVSMEVRVGSSNRDSRSPTPPSPTRHSREEKTRSFLEDRSLVTGVNDVINRMKAVDQETSREGESESDKEARSLLNKFLGAQVLIQGIEPMLQAKDKDGNYRMQKEVRTVQYGRSDDGGKTWDKRGYTASKVTMGDTVIVNGININDINDDKQLREMMEKCEEYDDRRKIRSRIKALTSGGKDDSAEPEERFEDATDVKQTSSSRRDSKSGYNTNMQGHSSSTTTVKTSSATGRSQGSSGDYQVKRSAYSSVTTSQTTSSSKVGGTSARAPSSPFAKFKQMDEKSSKSVPNSPMTPQTPGAGGSGPLFKFTDQGLSRSASGVKDMLLYWCQCRTRDYKNVQIENFSTSWNNGLAFCALIHHFYPDAFDYEALDPRNRRYNFDLAFRVADEKAGIAPLLDVDDMVAMKKPDWKCVFTYVQSIYRRLKDDS